MNKVNRVSLLKEYIAQIRGEKQRLSNFEQRDYSNFDFNKLYANQEIFVEGE